ncbi:DUF1080 domain-containing protein [uncultured Paludibaculum sp.]|uniref:3-keto-disaccharide hydrolase n=1 Tax=uncultured Paludibaculum sp. TaxID=1765020 RepID=UPI002AAAB5A9|nr:DUF1080 domain-containing protein [uncultured Paludibaculum sp.]
MLSRRTFLATVPAVTLAQTDDESGFQPVTGWTTVDGTESAYTITGSEVAVHSHASFPTWLRSGRRYENFELRGEFHVKGWTDSGLYLHAPEFGRPSQAGFQIKVFHQKEGKPTPYSVGAVFPLIAPSKINVQAGWNPIRVVFNWPRLQVSINGEVVQDLDVAANPELAPKLRSGYLGIVAASAECKFRNLRVKELPGQEKWQSLYTQPGELAAKWAVSEGKPNFTELGDILRADGAGHLASKEQFRDFQLQLYIRGCPQHNGGVLFRSGGRGTNPDKGYEIQLHPVEEAHFPTGSLYHFKRARYPRIEDGKWFLFELWVKGKQCRVRIDGDTILEYADLENLDEGFIELQAHRQGFWLEFKDILIQRL